jgi:two-component system sensor histidine kinase ChvG
MGEDWTRSDDGVEQELRTKREKRNLISLNRSPLARKIITFNLLALVLLVAGVLFLNPFRDSLVAQREVALVSEAQLIADVFEAQLAVAGEETVLANPSATLSALDIAPGVEVYVFSTN